jgi:hypothetical protein
MLYIKSSSLYLSRDFNFFKYLLTKKKRKKKEFLLFSNSSSVGKKCPSVQLVGQGPSLFVEQLSHIHDFYFSSFLPVTAGMFRVSGGVCRL